MGKIGRKTLLKMDSFTTFKSWKRRRKKKTFYQRLRCGRRDWPLPWMSSSNLSSWRLPTPKGSSSGISVRPSLFSSSSFWMFWIFFFFFFFVPVTPFRSFTFCLPPSSPLLESSTAQTKREKKTCCKREKKKGEIKNFWRKKKKLRIQFKQQKGSCDATHATHEKFQVRTRLASIKWRRREMLLASTVISPPPSKQQQQQTTYRVG